MRSIMLVLTRRAHPRTLGLRPASPLSLQICAARASTRILSRLVGEAKWQSSKIGFGPVASAGVWGALSCSALSLACSASPPLSSASSAGAGSSESAGGAPGPLACPPSRSERERRRRIAARCDLPQRHRADFAAQLPELSRDRRHRALSAAQLRSTRARSARRWSSKPRAAPCRRGTRRTPMSARFRSAGRTTRA